VVQTRIGPGTDDADADGIGHERSSRQVRYSR
jgi:hypothetical protein